MADATTEPSVDVVHEDATTSPASAPDPERMVAPTSTSRSKSKLKPKPKTSRKRASVETAAAVAATATATATAAAAAAVTAEVESDDSATKKRRRVEGKAVSPGKMEDGSGADADDEVETAADVKKRPTKRVRANATPKADTNQMKEDIASAQKITAILQTPGVLLTDTCIDALAPELIQRSMMKAGESAQSVVYVSPVNMDTVLKKHFNRDVSLTEATVHKLLGTTSTDVRNASVIFVPVYGPHTQRELAADAVFGGDMNQGQSQNHWSLLCWFADENVFMHYDSSEGVNRERALEVAGVFMSTKYNFLDARKRMPTIIMHSADHFPSQKLNWECGYYTLLAIHIITNKSGVSSFMISEYDTETLYLEHIQTITMGERADFPRFLQSIVPFPDIFS